MSKASILIVEDEAIIAADLAGTLRRLGYGVSGTTGLGEEAVNLARELRPDLILMDIRLAGAMDGVEAAEVIRRELDLPVVYLTAHSDRATLERAKLTDPFGYILKPFEELGLETHIEMALFKHQAERKLRQAHDELELRVQERTKELEEAERVLREVNETLEQRVAERTAELSVANASLRDSRLAALNIMEDAVVARRQVDEKIEELSREIAERKRVEEALRESEARVRRKLDSILSPEGEIGDLELADIIDARSMQSLMDNFYKLTSVPMGMIDLKGRVLVGVGWQDVCTKFHRVHHETCANCIESDTQLSAGVPQGEYKLYRCKNNMWDVATPIVVGGKHFGNFFMGQFLFDDEQLDYELFRAQARECGFDEKEYIAALEKVPRFSREFLDTGMAYFMELADIISRMSYSNIKLARSLAERDVLMDSLQKAHDQLETKVRERTEELATTIETLLGEIGERERAEKNLLRLNRLYAVLSETDQAIVRAGDRESLFREFCRIAVDEGAFLLAWVGLVDQENGRVNVVEASGATAYLDDIEISPRKEPTGEGPTGIAIREGTYCICNDFQNDPRTRPWHEKGRLHGIRASASVALREEERVIGALTLYAGEKDFFDQQHVGLLKQMGTEISFALDTLEMARRRREAELALFAETAERLKTMEELRMKEQMLLQQGRQAAMGEMIGNIAHQWRQPLNVLGLIVQDLPMHFELGEFSKEYLDKSVAKATQVIFHMSQTIDDFRNFFLPDKEKVSFSVNDVVTKTVSLVEGSFREQRIETGISATEEICLVGYPNEYSQVILNILINAKDAFAEGNSDLPRVVLIRLFRENDRAVVTIADNAGGIPEGIMEKIFDPYFTTKGPDKGTGVGLFMSKTIIEKNMNGRLSACNSGAGAEFRIEV